MITKIFPDLLEKGILVKPLLDSNVFNYQFDMDEWPANHYNDTETIRPYNENIFLIGNDYYKVFPEKSFLSFDDLEDAALVPSGKVYKIKYSVNLLPSIGMYVNKVPNLFTGEDEYSKMNQ